GDYLAILGRTPYVCAALTRDKEGAFTLTIRAPRGRKGMYEGDAVLHVPPTDKTGALPLLEPKGVIYSTSFYLDLAKLWTARDKILTKANAKQLAEFDKTSGRFLLGNRVSSMLQLTGPQHRLVVVNQAKTPYKKKPQVKIPAFAFLPGVKEPDKFARKM